MTLSEARPTSPARRGHGVNTFLRNMFIARLRHANGDQLDLTYYASIGRLYYVLEKDLSTHQRNQPLIKTIQAHFDAEQLREKSAASRIRRLILALVATADAHGLDLELPTDDKWAKACARYGGAYYKATPQPNTSEQSAEFVESVE